MKLATLSQLESEALMKDRMDAVKGGGDPSRYEKCLSCFCPTKKLSLEDSVQIAANLYEPEPEPD